MSNLDPTLDSLANQFKSWRKNRTHIKYPQSIWKEIYRLAENTPIPTIAQALGINPDYLKQRIKKTNRPSVTFEPIKISHPTPTLIEFQSKNNTPITVKLQANTEELARLIQLLG